MSEENKNSFTIVVFDKFKATVQGPIAWGFLALIALLSVVQLILG